MKHTWRWFGPQDPVPLSHVRQAGAAGVVTALHHIPVGAVWSIDEIMARKKIVEDAGLEWSVVESLPVSEDIKTQTGAWRQHLDHYRASLRNLAQCGIRTVCYNFMPVLDWTRTDLAYAMPDGGLALRFDAAAFAAFDLFVLKRKNAERDWTPPQIAHARTIYDAMDDAAHARLMRTIIAGLPGAEASYTLDQFRDMLACYRDIGADGLRANLASFAREIGPTAAEADVRLCIHPDDPPFPLLGLPRVLSAADDVRSLFNAFDDRANGLTFCTGSFGVRPDNDLPAMVRAFADRIHFIHLRSTKREPNPQGFATFHESPHLDGDVDMVAVIREVVAEERRRGGREDAQIPMRPDHGHQILDDIGKRTNPGYSAIGRLKGLAELRGAERAVLRLV